VGIPEGAELVAVVPEAAELLQAEAVKTSSDPSPTWDLSRIPNR